MARKLTAGPFSDPELLILASLAEGQKHGYAIMTDVLAFADVELGPGTLSLRSLGSLKCAGLNRVNQADASALINSRQQVAGIFSLSSQRCAVWLRSV